MSDEHAPNEDRLSAIDTYLQRGDCRSAEDVWERLNDEWKSGKTVYTRPVLDEKLQHITQTSRQLVDNSLADIEAFLKKEDIDERTARAKLYDLDRALLNQERYRYDVISNRLLNRVQLNKENVLFADIEKTVKQLWDEAVALQMRDKNISPAKLLPYYTQALEEATRQVLQYEKTDQYSENFKNRLRALRQEAEKRRNSIDTAEVSLTSGALVGDYIKTLQYIRDISPDMPVQIYDPQGVIEDTTDKVSAKDKYSKRAREFARNKLIVYTDGGEGFLGIRQLLDLGRPREAEQRHQHYLDTFGELEAKYVPEITHIAEREALFDWKTKIDVALNQLEQVEKQCDAIAKRAESATTRPDLISLWNEYLASLKQYPLAQQTSVVVIQTEAIIKRRFNDYLVRVADEVDVAIQTTKFGDARKIIREHRTVLELPLVKNEEVASRIAAYETELTTIDRQVQDIRATLADLSLRLITDSTTSLKASLDQIKHDFPLELLRSNPEYESIEAQITSRDSAVADAKRLEGYLASPNMATVESKAKYAREKALITPIYEAIANELEAYLDFMQAENLPLDKKVEALRQLTSSGRVSNPDRKKQIAEAYAQAEAEQRLVTSNGVLFKRAEDELRHKNYAEVWKSLEMIKALSDTAEEEKWARLFIQSVNEYPLTQGLDANSLGALGEFLHKLPNAYEPPRYSILRDVQRAREQGGIQDRIERYETIRTRLSGADADTLDDMINQLRQTQFLDESSKLLTERPSPQGLEAWLSGLSEYAQKGLDLARRQPNQAGGYYLNSLKLDVLFVQNTPIFANRKATATRTKETATLIDRLDGFAKTMTDADLRLLDAAKHMRALVDAMDDMTKFVTKTEPNIQNFKDTLDKLGGYFEGTSRYRAVLHDFAGQYDAHINSVYTELSNENNATKPSERYTPKSFLRYVKMLLLRPSATQEIDNVIKVENLRDKFVTQLQQTFDAFMSDSHMQLSEIVTSLDEQYRDLQKFIAIVDSPSLKQFQEFAGEIKDTAEVIPKLIGAVQKFDDRATSFYDRLTNYDLSYATLNQHNDVLNKEYEALKTEVTALFKGLPIETRLKIGDVGATHPVMMRLGQELHHYLGVFDAVVQNWTNILIRASWQDFAYALVQMEQFENLTVQFQIFQGTSLYNDKLPDVLLQEDGDPIEHLPNVNGYASLKNWLLEGGSTYEHLMTWRNQHANILNGIANFEDVFARAEEFQRSAQFQRAKDVLNAIITSSSETNLKKYENIPYVARQNGQLRVMGSYNFDAALKACPYFQSRELIMLAQGEYQHLTEKRHSAQGILMKYDQEAGHFKALETRFPGVFTEWEKLATQRNPNRKRLEALQKEINDILARMWQIAPASASYKSFTERLSNLGSR